MIELGVILQVEDGWLGVNDEGNHHEKHQLRFGAITKECVNEAEVVLAIEHIAEEATQ
jgi:hypothetical protein